MATKWPYVIFNLIEIYGLQAGIWNLLVWLVVYVSNECRIAPRLRKSCSCPVVRRVRFMSARFLDVIATVIRR